MNFSELQIDFIKEMFNTGMGSAAVELGDLVNEEVVLSVPDFQLSPVKDVIARIGIETNRIVNTISVRLSGDLEGDGMLVFPETNSLDLVRTFTDGEEEIASDSMTGQEQEALTEISGIILNHLITTLSEFLALQINSSMPSCHHDKIGRILVAPAGGPALIMFVGMSFSVKSLNLSGDILFLQNVESTEAFITHVQKVLDENGLS